MAGIDVLRAWPCEVAGAAFAGSPWMVVGVGEGGQAMRSVIQGPRGEGSVELVRPSTNSTTSFGTYRTAIFDLHGGAGETTNSVGAPRGDRRDHRRLQPADD